MFKSVINFLEELIKYLPALSVDNKKTLLKLAAPLALVVGIGGTFFSIFALIILIVFSPFAILGIVNGYGNGFAILFFSLFTSILFLSAYSDTRKLKLSGFNKFFFAVVVGIFGLLFTGGYITAIIIGFLGVYLLFQIKPYFK